MKDVCNFQASRLFRLSGAGSVFGFEGPCVDHDSQEKKTSCTLPSRSVRISRNEGPIIQ